MTFNFVTCSSLLFNGYDLYSQKYIDDYHKEYPGDNKILKDVDGNRMKSFLRAVVPGDIYCFIIVGYQKKTFFNLLKKFDIEKYIRYCSTTVTNKVHPADRDHMQMVIIIFPKDYKYV